MSYKYLIFFLSCVFFLYLRHKNIGVRYLKIKKIQKKKVKEHNKNYERVKLEYFMFKKKRKLKNIIK